MMRKADSTLWSDRHRHGDRWYVREWSRPYDVWLNFAGLALVLVAGVIIGVALS